MNLLVGCPTARRGWILPRWAEHIDKAAADAGLTPRFIVLADPGDDAWHALKRYDDRLTRIVVTEPRHDGLRDWCTPGRLAHIIDLRNQLLTAVRAQAPDVFLSVDSDMLLHPATITNLLETLADFDAVGGYAYMNDGHACPSWGRILSGGALDRVDMPGYVGPVEVIMAIKAMTPAAYAHDYTAHPKGEDVGICLAWRDAGVRVGLDARVTSKHVMRRDLLDLVDERCGF